MLRSGGMVTRATFGSIPSGLDGVRATLRLMVGTTRHFLKPTAGDADRVQALLQVRMMASNLVLDIPEKDYFNECAALQRFARDAIRYTEDMRGAEQLQYPDFTLATQAGDCDDKAILFCSLASCIGRATRFAAIAVPTDDDPNGECFSHVCGQAMVPGRGWINAECIPIDDQGTKVEFGWFPPDATCIMLAHI
jgi:transglutaminase-like putative cysteine protease